MLGRATRGLRPVALLLSIALIGSYMVTGQAGAAGGKPKVVLDPDHGFATSSRGEGPDNSFPINLQVAQGVAALLPSVCAADIVITQTTDGGPSAASRAARAAQMGDADLSVTLSMNSLDGDPWGFDPEQGGSSSYATNRGDNLAFGNDLAQQMAVQTGRPFDAVNTGPTGGRVYPYPEFTALSGTYSQLFMLFMDNNFDFPVWHQHPELLVRAVTTGIANSLKAQGFKCLGSFPPRPSAAELLRLRNLGYQQFLKYNADPISMSTGNFTTSEEVFTLPGVGSQAIDLTLNYNAQSGQDSPVGIGWTFGYGSYLQQYSDGTVAVFLPDGRALAYAPDAAGGFTSPAGAFASLTQVDDTFTWRTTTETALTFVQDSSGRGRLTATKDRQGNRETLAYNGDGDRFPKLVSITDEAGQQVGVATNDDGRIASFTRPDGGVWNLAYSPAGELVSITSARGTDREFAYDIEHRMTSQAGQDGVTFLTNTYDNQSRVIKQTNAFGEARTLAFDDSARTTTFTDTEGGLTIYHWNELGQVTKVVDAIGGETETSYSGDLLPTADTNPLDQTTARSYDASGKLASLTDPLGNVVSSTYNTSGDVTSTTDEGGADGAARTVSYSLNGDGLPITVTNPDGTTQTHTFNAFGDVTSSTDENGATTTYDYDDRGNTTSVKDPLGRVTTMTYDLANRLTSVKDPLGRTTSYDYDANDNLTLISHPNGASEERSYDTNDQLQASTDRRGATTSYIRDAELNLIRVDLPNGGVITNTFDNENRLTSTTDPEGNTTTFTLDALGRRIATKDARGHDSQMAYDAADRLSSHTDPTGSTTTFVPDANGRVLTVTDPVAGVLTNEWDDVGRQRSLTDQLGRTTRFTYNFRDQVVTTTDPAGGVTTNSYDAAGRLISQTDPAGAKTTFSYDAAGQLIQVSDALGGVTSLTYDAAGNQLTVTDPSGHATTTAYNSMDEPVSRTDGRGKTWTMSRDKGGLVVAEADPLGHKTKHLYDAIGNLTASTDPLNRTMSFGYDRNQRPITETAADGVITANQYDAVGNLTAVIRNQRGGEPASSSVNVATRYGYDSRNLLTSTTDANGAVTSYVYDQRGQLTSTTGPLGKVASFSYDAVGNRTGRTDANGVLTTYSYDPRNLLTKQAYPDGSAETFSYDAVGRQLTATNASGTVRTTYDLLGRPAMVDDAAGKTLTYGYDPGGNRTRLTLPDGRILDYRYDAADQMTELTSPLGKLTTTYDAAGRPTTTNRPNGTTLTASFDGADQLTGLITKAGSSVLASFDYTYDSVGNVASRAQKLGSTTTTTNYSYDPLRRLTNTTGGPLPSSYSYDAVGNRLSSNASDDPLTPKPNDPVSQSNVFNAAGQVTKSTMVRQNGGTDFTSETSHSYDHNGNRMLSDTVAQAPGQSTATAYTYDFENRLKTSMPADVPQQGNGNGQRNYDRSHDALGRLVTETRGTTTTTWTADGLDPIIASDPKASTFYLRDAGGELEGELTSGLTPEWYVSDALGSILAATTTAAKPKLVNVTPYSDYGVKLAKSTYRMGFGGEIADPNYPGNGIGNDTPVLTHYYARSYDPGTGNWLQRDPYEGDLARPETLAPYQFVGGNPSTNVDLLGFLTVGNYSYTGTVSVVNSTSSWNGGDLQASSSSAQVLQPTYNPQQTVDASYLQPTANPFKYTAYRSPASKGQLGSLSSGSLLTGLRVQPVESVSGSALQGSRAQYGGTEVPWVVPSSTWSGGYPRMQGSDYLTLQGPGAVSGRIAVPRFSGQIRPSSGPTSGLAARLLYHYEKGSGDDYYIGWSTFSDRSDFRERALSAPVGGRVSYTPPWSDLYFAIGEATIIRYSASCYAVYDEYDFEVQDPGDIPHVTLYLDSVWFGAREFKTWSVGCLD